MDSLKYNDDDILIKPKKDNTWTQIYIYYNIFILQIIVCIVYLHTKTNLAENLNPMVFYPFIFMIINLICGIKYYFYLDQTERDSVKGSIISLFIRINIQDKFIFILISAIVSFSMIQILCQNLYILNTNMYLIAINDFSMFNLYLIECLIQPMLLLKYCIYQYKKYIFMIQNIINILYLIGMSILILTIEIFYYKYYYTSPSFSGSFFIIIGLAILIIIIFISIQLIAFITDYNIFFEKHHILNSISLFMELFGSFLLILISILQIIRINNKFNYRS